MTQRLFVGTSTVSHTFTDGIETPVEPTVVTCTVVAHDGATVTTGSITTPSTGKRARTVSVSAPTMLTVTWVADGATFVDEYDVVAAPYVTVTELRDSDSKFLATPAATLVAAITDAEAECDNITGRAWGRKYTVETLTPRDGDVRLSWPDVVRIGKVTASYAGTTLDLTSTAILEPNGELCVELDDDWSIEVGYEYGRRSPDREIRRAVLIRAGQFVRSPTSAVAMFSERVTFGDSGSTVRLLPKANATGVAEVDAIYARHAFAGGVGIA